MNRRQAAEFGLIFISLAVIAAVLASFVLVAFELLELAVMAVTR